jgi:hypothetical protein
MKHTHKVKAECGSCSATGVYCGFAEPKGTGVVCLNCDGSGWVDIEYTPFSVLKRRKGVDTVKRSRGSFIVTGVGPVGDSVSYEEFFNGKKPR